MMKLYEILLMGLVLVVCTSETPHNIKPAKEYVSIVDPLDAIRIEYRCSKNEWDKKAQEAYISTSEIKQAFK